MSSIAATGAFGRLALRCQPDTRLVALTREGADPAFEEVVRRYRGRLVAYASGIVRPDRAEDVVQDSLVRALSAVRDSDSEINLRPWLHTIVRNRALNDLRDEPALEHLDENFDGVPQPPDVAARKEELAGVVDQVKALPHAQREALVQREFEGRSHEEIAAAMDVTPGAVRGLIFRARSSLRDVAGLAIPMPVLRALIESSAAGGGAATVAAAGGGGGLVKIGAVIGVAAVAIGSGVAIHDHDGSGGNEATADSRPPVHRTHHSTQQASSGLSSDAATATNASSTSASDNGGGRSRSADASGSGQGSSGSGSGGSSGPSPAGGSSGPRPSSGSGSSSGGGGDDHSGSGAGGGSPGGGEPGDGGGGGTTTTGDGGGDHSGPGGGGDGGGGTVQPPPTGGGVDGGDHSGPGGGGGDGGDGGTVQPPSGGGDGGGTTTTTTTTPLPPHGD
jgi:RNA polymerase sigma-70 factor (ECF subfamily)